ncbi:diguanylate cyclase [Halopseudomonas salegens]|uniref:diguanylate cyclase n=1 Tax=Halopseudomonas salegens TaxID=1434072 RepID=A0A1H2EL19_9GAMM|nr:diguanylate cyclase [Halopseudomonas salegens]SDT95807.1 diguanylate cyclase (GGDEF) domain-containing protein [Halopseudomonas salegens]
MPSRHLLKGFRCLKWGQPISTHVAKGYEWSIKPWWGEFRNKEHEQAFLRQHAPLVAGQLQLALLVWMFLLLIFAIPDYLTLGPGTDFFILLAMRLATSVLILALFVAVGFKAQLAVQGRWISLVEVVAISLFMLVYFYRPDILSWTITVTLLMILGVIALVPNRLKAAVPVAFYMAVLTALVLLYLGSLDESEFVGLLVIFSLPIGIGWAGALRANVLQRRQFALFQQSTQLNAELTREIEMRKRLQEQLQHQATTDALTGLNNRHQYQQLFARELSRSMRLRQPMSLGIIDLDHFKQVNDTWGHSAGDEVLRRVAQLCRDNFRDIDILGRLGGEEFVVLLPDTTQEQAIIVAQRFIETLANTPIDIGTRDIQVTATIGVVTRQPDETSLEGLIKRADDALYKGKEAGRNQVMPG